MNPLAVLARIIPDQEENLRRILAEIDQDLEGNPYIRFADSPRTHFARFVILSDEDNGPRLLFTTNFDGEYDSYLRELDEITLRAESIWGKCEGFDDDTDLPAFLCHHAEKNRGTYVAFQDETVQTIQAKLAIRRQLEAFLDHDGVADYLTGDRVGAFLDLLSSLPPPRRSLWTAFGELVSRAWQLLAKRFHDWFFALLLDPPLELAKRFSNAAIADHFNKVTVYSAAEVDRTPQPLSQVARQTSFTVYAKVKRGLRWRLRLAIALPGTSILARYGYPPGNFANVFTLYAFRWLWIDNRQRIVFQSTFDGSWGNYMSDFIDNLVWALNALYASCEGYPEGGMADVYRFERWIEEHQPQPLVVYNAYPEATVINLMTDREISRRLVAHYDRAAAEEWLRSL